MITLKKRRQTYTWAIKTPFLFLLTMIQHASRRGGYFPTLHRCIEKASEGSFVRRTTLPKASFFPAHAPRPLCVAQQDGCCMKKIRYDHRANIETRVHQCFQCLMLLRGGAQPLRHVERRATRSLRSKFRSGAVLTLEQAEEERRGEQRHGAAASEETRDNLDTN